MKEGYLVASNSLTLLVYTEGQAVNDPVKFKQKYICPSSFWFIISNPLDRYRIKKENNK